jgi:hypothetical protein
MCKWAALVFHSAPVPARVTARQKKCSTTLHTRRGQPLPGKDGIHSTQKRKKQPEGCFS